MMRGAMSNGTREFKMKGNGIIVGTGAGSTGWLDAARKHVYPFGKEWARTERRAEFGQMMSFGSSAPLMEFGELDERGTLTFVSSGNRKPTISGDSVWFRAFPRGSVARIRLSDAPLKVVARS
jgi:hypothetical protein